MAKRIGRFTGIPPWEHNKRVRFWKDMRAAIRAFNRAELRVHAVGGRTF